MQQNDNLNILEPCTFLTATNTEQIMTDISILQDENEH